MEVLRGVFLIFMFWALGETLTQLARLPIPGAVFGMLGLWVALQFKWVSYASVQVSAKGFLGMMGVFFVPPSLGILLHIDRMLEYGWKLALLVVFTSILSGVTTALVFKLLNR
jgi:holin-like protein